MSNAEKGEAWIIVVARDSSNTSLQLVSSYGLHAGSVRHAGLPLATPLPAAPPIILDDDEQSAPLLDVPSLDAPMRSDTVLAALEQLRAAYKVSTPCCAHSASLHCMACTHGAHVHVNPSYG